MLLQSSVKPVEVYIYTHLALCRRSDIQVTHSSSKEYSPSAALLDFWRKWDNSPEDIQDCTVVCTK